MKSAGSKELAESARERSREAGSEVPTEPYDDAKWSEPASPIGLSLAEWGETKINWNSVHKGKTYLEVYATIPSYVKWTESHATATMADWVAFIAAMKKPIW